MIIKPLQEKGWFKGWGFYDGRYYEEYGKTLIEVIERLFISIQFAE